MAHAFISYSHRDRVMARACKTALHGLGVEAFLAHEDVQVSEEWRGVLIEKLKAVEIFVPLLSDNFSKSVWCAHEVGFIVSRPDVPIIPLSLDDTVPTGFIAHVQGKRINSAEDFKPVLERVLPRKAPRIAIPAWIERVRNAGSFRGAEAIVAPMVEHFGLFTKEEARGFADAALANVQVWDAGDCRVDHLPAFARAHWPNLKPAQRSLLLERLGTTKSGLGI